MVSLLGGAYEGEHVDVDDDRAEHEVAKKGTQDKLVALAAQGKDAVCERPPRRRRQRRRRRVAERTHVARVCDHLHPLLLLGREERGAVALRSERDKVVDDCARKTERERRASVRAGE